MTKILITGSTGFLGSRLAYHFRDKAQLLLPTHAELNVSREEAVRAYLEEHRPDVVLHCAALSRTDYCEQHPEESHRVNVQGTVKLAKACKQIGAKLVFMSSDQVYNGTPLPGALKEDDVLQPVSVYGRHKLEAEQRALWNNPASVGLRLTWMYDMPGIPSLLDAPSLPVPLRQSVNIVSNLYQADRIGSGILAAIHEYRGVTDVWQVVRNMEKAMSLPGGIYNFGCSTTLNSYELHRQAAAMMKLERSTQCVHPDEDRFSEQDRNLTMDCALIASYGIHFTDSIEGIRKALYECDRMKRRYETGR